MTWAIAVALGATINVCNADISPGFDEGSAEMHQKNEQRGFAAESAEVWDKTFAKSDKVDHRKHSRYFTEDAYKQAAEPKELVVVPNARHIDLYDRSDMIPFDKIASFFGEHLK